MPFSYIFPKHNCFQQDEMRKKHIKIVPRLLAFKFMAEESPGTHICGTKKIFVNACQVQNRAVTAITWKAWNA